MEREISAGENLEAWFTKNGRDLPWRRDRNPWAVLVSEMMLQQTQVERVVSRWPRFLRRFPNPTAMAARPVAEVIDEWAGLGYNRRAVNLHRCASAIVERFDGVVPSSPDDLQSLPGIGPYTARAVAVFAFESQEAVVDTNVARILARVHNRALSGGEAQRLADQWARGRDPWVWNQALIDVGALFCRPGHAACELCPLHERCRWRAVRTSAPDPAVGSAGVSGRQSKFEGSDRQGRGRLVKALRRCEVAAGDLASTMGWPEDPERAERVAGTLLADGLVELVDGRYQLPG